MDIRNKVTVITGAASGIGAACASAFANEGAKVVVADINEAGADEVAAQVGGLAMACDVADAASINNLVRQTEQQFGPVDIFFSNAGIESGGSDIHTPMDVWNRHWQVNVMSHVYAVQAVLPGMLARGSGYLLQTASMAGMLTSLENLPYATTKHAAVGLAEWLAITYHHNGIRSSLLAPLGVNTPMLKQVSGKILSTAGEIKEPEQVAAMVIDAVREERFLILTDPIAQQWMDRKNSDIERWLKGMRRVQGEINQS